MENIGTKIKIYFEEHLLDNIDENVWWDNVDANVRKNLVDTIRAEIWSKTHDNIHLPIIRANLIIHNIIAYEIK